MSTRKPTPYQLALAAGGDAMPVEARQLRVPIQAMGGRREDAKQWDAGGTNLASRSVTLLARTPGMIDHWWFGPIVHDFAGMRHKAAISLDYKHDYYELVGYADQFAVDAAGLTASGTVVSRQAGDRASQIIADYDAKIPLEASIDWSRGSVVLEDVPAGATVEVNGLPINGPVVVVRSWELMAIAICPHGVDGGTSVTMGDSKASSETASAAVEADTDAAQLVSVKRWSAPSPTAPTPKRTRLEQLPVDLDDDDAPAPASVVKRLSQPGSSQLGPSQATSPQPPAIPSHATSTGGDLRAELAQYVRIFGAENGAKWFAESTPLLECWPKHLAAVEASHASRVEALEKELAAAKHKLASVDRGEPTAVSFASDEAPAKASPPRATVSSYAASINKQAAALHGTR